MLYYKTLKSGNIFWSVPHSLSLSLCECHSQSITIFVCVTLKSHQASAHIHAHIIIGMFLCEMVDNDSIYECKVFGGE